MKKLVVAVLTAGMMAGGAFILTGPAGAHEPGSYESPIVEERVKRFKQSGADIQSVFKKHLGAGDFTAIEEAAERMARWGAEMPDAFPVGSPSVGADNAIWQNFPDFKRKAEMHTAAAWQLKAAAGSGDRNQVLAAAKRVGGTCKACHTDYRIKH